MAARAKGQNEKHEASPRQDVIPYYQYVHLIAGYFSKI
jgi:hypothetical protein